MKQNENDRIIITMSKLVSPFIMLFALYVIFHGHYSPGGGFQGGTMLAAAVILFRLAAGSENGQMQFRRILGTPLGSVGVLIYFGTGFVAMLSGGRFLDYKYLPIPGVAPSMLRAYGILSVEIGVGLAVMAVLVAIYDDLLLGKADE